MDKFKIISALEDYAISKGWVFLSGKSHFQNFEATQNVYSNGQLVLTADFSIQVPPFGQNTRVLRYNLQLMLGQKFDTNSTPSSLDETFKQKYDRRLENLFVLFSNFIQDFSCINELSYEQYTIDYELNIFDTNIDFVGGNIIFLQ